MQSNVMLIAPHWVVSHSLRKDGTAWRKTCKPAYACSPEISILEAEAMTTGTQLFSTLLGFDKGKSS